MLIDYHSAKTFRIATPCELLFSRVTFTLPWLVFRHDNPTLLVSIRTQCRDTIVSVYLRGDISTYARTSVAYYSESCQLGLATIRSVCCTLQIQNDPGSTDHHAMISMMTDRAELNHTHLTFILASQPNSHDYLYNNPCGKSDPALLYKWGL